MATTVSPYETTSPPALYAVPDRLPTTIDRQTAYIGGAAVNFTVETPPPEAIVDQIPVVFIQGFMGPELVYEDLRAETAQQGRVAVSIGRAGLQHPLTMLEPKNFFHQDRLTSQSPYGVIRSLHREHGHTQVDLVCHSMGGPIGANIALHKPGRVRSVTLLGSAGLTGHNPLSLAARMPYAVAEIAKGMPFLIERFGKEGALAIANYFGVNPIRPGFEAWSVARADIRGTLPELYNEGIAVRVGAFAKDCFFNETVVEREVAGSGASFTVIEADLAGHIAPQLQPHLVAEELLNL